MIALLDAINRYEGSRDPRDLEVSARFRELLRAGATCAERTHYRPGHLTGSALVATEGLDRVLLTLHRKLNRWLQLGGHADGSLALDAVALREAQEESGLSSFDFVVRGIFDLDIHWIPEGKEPGHYHYDARYLLTTPEPERISISDESHALRWFSLDEARAVTDEPSMLRLFEKLEALRATSSSGR